MSEERCVHKNVELEAISGTDEHVLHCKDCDARLTFCEDCAWRNAAGRLASCAIFTLNHYKHLGRGSGNIVDLSVRPFKTIGPWQDKFFDSLDLIGYEIDRKAFYKPKKKAKKPDAKAHANPRRKESRPRSSRRARTPRTGRAKERIGSRR